VPSKELTTSGVGSEPAKEEEESDYVPPAAGESESDNEETLEQEEQLKASADAATAAAEDTVSQESTRLREEAQLPVQDVLARFSPEAAAASAAAAAAGTTGSGPGEASESESEDVDIMETDSLPKSNAPDTEPGQQADGEAKDDGEPEDEDEDVELVETADDTEGSEEPGLEYLLQPIDADPSGPSGAQRIESAAKSAAEAQPTGSTLETTKVKTKVPALLSGSLREYQHIGLDWLVSMYEKNLNGILADEVSAAAGLRPPTVADFLFCRWAWARPS
jgi:hypothetical protein